MQAWVIDIARVVVVIPLVDLRAEVRLLFLLSWHRSLWITVIHVTHWRSNCIVVGELLQLIGVWRDKMSLLTLHLLFSQKSIVLLVRWKCLASFHDLFVILLGFKDFVILLLQGVILVFDNVTHLLLRLLKVGAPSSRPASPSVEVILIISLGRPFSRLRPRSLLLAHHLAQISLRRIIDNEVFLNRAIVGMHVWSDAAGVATHFTDSRHHNSTSRILSQFLEWFRWF